MNFTGIRVSPILPWTVIIVLFILYSVVRIHIISDIAQKPRSLRDTQAYLRISNEPILSGEFLAGSRPFGFPLVLKLLDGDPVKVAWVQGFFSLLSWTMLAFFVARAIRKRVFAPFVFGGFLLLSIQHKIIGWDATMLTESLSLSLMVLFIALWLWLTESWSWIKVAALATTAFFWAFTRDTNAWMLLMIAVFLTLLVLMNQVTKRYIILAGIFTTIFLVSNYSAEAGKRWVFPFNNVMAGRILVDENALEFFKDCGMPVNSTLLELAEGFAGSDERAFSLAPELEGYRVWLNESGKLCYAKWLLSNPVRNISQPLSDAKGLLSLERLDSFFFSRELTPVLPTRLEAILLPSRWINGTLVVTYLIILSALFFGGLKQTQAWLVVITLCLLVFPHYFLVWHGDTIGIHRHVLSVGIQLYLGLWLAMTMLFDAVISSPVADTLIRKSNRE